MDEYRDRSIDMLVEELADARERLSVVEGELQARHQAEAAARDPEDELKRAEGERILQAINAGRRRSSGGGA